MILMGWAWDAAKWDAAKMEQRFASGPEEEVESYFRVAVLIPGQAFGGAQWIAGKKDRRGPRTGHVDLA